jgi:ubiquinone/menaquinone biosynthesis C-methylase UbiE
MTACAADTPNFDSIARLYRWIEYATFGWSLERCRNRFLPQLQGCRRALVLGDGDGRFLARLLAVNPGLRADAVDTSAHMLHLLRTRCSAVTDLRLRTHHHSALEHAPASSTDLIVTHFFLDCLTQSEVDELARRLAWHIRPGALWVVSEFRIPAGAMHWPSRILVRLLYRAFHLITGLCTRELPDHATALTAAGLVRIAQHLSLAGLLTSELWQRREYTPAMLPPQHPRIDLVADPLPDPEPASPSLPGPDPGVFHREPGASPPEPPTNRPPPA